MLQRIIIFIMFCLITQPASAQISLKVGDAVTISNYLTREFSYGVSYEYKIKDNALEFETGFTITQIKNERWLKPRWTKRHGHGDKVWGDNSKRGRLYIFPVALSYKRYFFNQRLFAGIGAGWQFFDFREYYDGKAKVHGQPLQQLYGGYNINKNWAIEVKKIWSDLDIESGNDDIGLAENYSRLNRITISINYKF